jgi:hypothetical protein
VVWSNKAGITRQIKCIKALRKTQSLDIRRTLGFFHRQKDSIRPGDMENAAEIT